MDIGWQCLKGTKEATTYSEKFPEKLSPWRWWSFWRLSLPKHLGFELEGVIDEHDLARLAKELPMCGVHLSDRSGQLVTNRPKKQANLPQDASYDSPSNQLPAHPANSSAPTSKTSPSQTTPAIQNGYYSSPATHSPPAESDSPAAAAAVEGDFPDTRVALPPMTGRRRRFVRYLVGGCGCPTGRSIGIGCCRWSRRACAGRRGCLLHRRWGRQSDLGRIQRLRFRERQS